MAQYKIGTATFTNGSATVTGSGTSWLSNVSVNNWIARAGTANTTYPSYIVGSVVSDTEITLTAPYSGDTAVDAGYVAHKDFTPDGAPIWANGDVEFASIQNEWNRKTPNKEKIITSIASVADLFGLTGVAGQQINLLNYYPGVFALADPTPKGGGILAYNPDLARSNHNGGTIHSPARDLAAEGRDTYLTPSVDTDLGCWVRINVDAFNVTWFGAVGNGLVDDTAPIQATFDAVKSGGAVYFPKTGWAQTGNLEPQYLISDDIVITKADLGIFGDTSSEYTGGIMCNTPNVKMFNFKSPGSRISNLAFFGNGSNTEFGTTTGIYIDRRDSGDSDNFANLDFIIDNCLFFDCGTGVYGWGRNVLIKDNLFTHLKTSVRCSSWIPSGDTSHVDIRGWRIRGNRFHSNGWQYAYPGTTETPPGSFGTWDSFCIQMPTDSDNFRHIEVTNNNADRGYSIFYRGMVSGLKMSGNIFHDFNGAMCYGLTTTPGAIDQQNKFPSQISCNLLNMRDSYLEAWDVAKSYGIIITGGCNALNISGNNIENTLFDAIEVRDTKNLTMGDNNVKNAGQTKLNGNPAHEAVTLNNCDGATVSGLNVSSTYSDPNHNSVGLNLILCANVSIGSPSFSDCTVNLSGAPDMLISGDQYGLGYVNPALNAPYTYNSGAGYQRMIDGSTMINLRVLGNSAASGTVIFTLPVGCRPVSDMRQNGVGSADHATITVSASTGDVTMTYTSTASPLYNIDMQFPSS